MLRLKKTLKTIFVEVQVQFFVNLCFKQKEIQDSKLSVIGPFRGLCAADYAWRCGG